MPASQQFFNSGAQSVVIPTNETNFGVLPFGPFGNTARADITASLNARYIRSTIIMNAWTGVNTQYEYFVSRGLKVVLNINYGNPAVEGPVPFPTDMTAYGTLFTNIMGSLSVPPELVVIENEEINPQFHSGPINNYIAMLATAVPIVQGFGGKATNGGVYSIGFNCSIFRYLKAVYGQTRADEFGHAALGSFGYNAANNPGSRPTVETAIDTITTIKNGIISSGADYFNAHPYSPYGDNVTVPADVIAENPYIYGNMFDYLLGASGVPGISNEIGQRDNSQALLVTSVLSQVKAAGAKYAVWFSGDDDDGAVALQNNDQSLRPNGEAFAAYLNSLV